MKRLLIAAIFLATGAAQAQTANYTLADVALHATAADCWMVLNSNMVYSLANYIALHPGGNVMVNYCGKDGTVAFNGTPHSAHAISLEPAYLIGNLVSTPLPISVALAPANATAAVGGTVQFTPTVSNSTQGVTWTVVPSSLGTISASGMFTALTVGQGTVTAASAQDRTKSASSVLTVSATTPPPVNTITVTVTPSAMTVSVGSRLRFRATLTHSTQGVTWTTKGSIGTIDSRGVFTAAATPGTGTVTATSIDDPNKSASAQVTLTAATCTPGDPSHPPRSGTDD